MIERFLKKLIGEVDYSIYIPEIVDFLEKCIWPLVAIVFIYLFRKEIQKLLGRVKKLKVGDNEMELEPPHGTTPMLDRIVKEPRPKREEDAKSRYQLAIVNLALLLGKYLYVWCAWDKRKEFSHAVRFSEEYSGGKLRYIDEYFNDLKKYLIVNDSNLSPDLRKSANELKDYIESILVYHNKYEELHEPVFSLQQYQKLFEDLLKTMGKE